MYSRNQDYQTFANGQEVFLYKKYILQFFFNWKGLYYLVRDAYRAEFGSRVKNIFNVIILQDAMISPMN